MTDPFADLPAAAHRAVDLYMGFLTGLDERRVAPACSRADLRRFFANSIQDEGVGLPQVLAEVETHVLPASMTTPHPCYAGLVNSSPLPAAPIADLLVSMLNNNGGAYHQSPASTTAEEEVVRAFKHLLGYPASATGLLLPGGTFANLHGLLLAREAKFPAWRTRGAAAAREPRLYASAAAHFSVLRVAQVAGLGSEQVVEVGVRGRGEIDVADLRRRVAADRAAGATPFAVVATVGTTGTGAIDDLTALGNLCAEYGLWLHVDACYGGAAALVEHLRGRFHGIAAVDSVAIDAHKWFFLPITAGLALTRHPAVEASAFAVDASYIPGDDELDPFRRGVPTSRRSSGLTVWAALRAHGLATVRAAVARNIEQTRALEERLAAAGLAVLPGGELSIAVARMVPTGWDTEAVDRLQGEIARRVVGSGVAWFATTAVDGRTWLRFNLLNLHTRDAHVVRIAEATIAAARDAVASA